MDSVFIGVAARVSPMDEELIFIAVQSYLLNPTHHRYNV
jgi:hypothetical protein